MMSETMSATDFKAKCHDILDRVRDRELERVLITEQGRVVAVLTAPAKAPKPVPVENLHGCMRGTAFIAPDADLTAPTSEGPWDAELGILHR